MPDPINLNRFRKQKARAEKEAQAAENRVRFGRTKAEKEAEAEEAARKARLLDGHRRDGDEPDRS
ncbi:DUF4169 family protein [Kaistia geumhonensis]|uniref:DUF4169 domain-containing protein n=1 Tax=Kaistia geumhonensis TaxID=410839 RepID=A0ABU0MC06_9HYPH|nr:DUF4169 family protein [Kaistia geumhonensis]MCX5481426.1 DUF4169 family protein [Kaistia geumhonensis]MDQ0518491.1 hypothetical protein [Kaistia geumhonensis]